MFIQHPFDATSGLPSTVTMTTRDVRKTSQSWIIQLHPFLLFARDVAFGIWTPIRHRIRVGLFVGVDPLNAICGIVLRRLGFADMVVFYAVDYTPRRFNSSLANLLYQFSVKLAARKSNLCWSISKRVTIELRRMGVSETNIVKVPYCVDQSVVAQRDWEVPDPIVVYMGNLEESKGVGILLDAFEIIRRRVPKSMLVVIGGGRLGPALKADADNRLAEVTFTGFMKDRSEVFRILSHCRVGVAPYIPAVGSYAFYNDPGKVKDYLVAGLPVVMTRVSEFSFDIERNDAGKLVNYDKNDLADSVIELLENDALFRRQSQNALRLGEDFSAEKVFTDALAKTLRRRTMS